MDINVTTNPNEVNHVRNDYSVANIFLAFPTKIKKFTFVNGTAAERIIKAGTLVGIPTGDQTIAEPVKSDGSNGSQIGFGAVTADITIPAGATEEAQGLVGWNGIIYEDKVVLEKAGDTLDTVIVSEGQSVRNALLNSNSLLQIEAAAQDISGLINEQV